MAQDRYTRKASNTVFFARYESSQCGSETVEPEHILLGLLRSDPELIQLLSPNKANDIAAIRASVEICISKAPEVERRTEVTPFSNAAEGIMRLATEASKRLGQDLIASEHILLGLLEGVTSHASRILKERGLSVEGIESKVSGGSITDQNEQGRGQGVLRGSTY